MALLASSCRLPDLGDTTAPDAGIAFEQLAIGVPSPAFVSGRLGLAGKLRPVDLRCPDGSCFVERRADYQLLLGGLEVIPTGSHVTLAYDAETVGPDPILVSGLVELEAVAPRLTLSIRGKSNAPNGLVPSAGFAIVAVGLPIEVTPALEFPRGPILPHGLEVRTDDAASFALEAQRSYEGRLTTLTGTPARSGRFTFEARGSVGPIALEGRTFIDVAGRADVTEQWLISAEPTAQIDCGADFVDCKRGLPLVAERAGNSGAFVVRLASLFQVRSGGHGVGFASSTEVLTTPASPYWRGADGAVEDSIGFPSAPPQGTQIATTLGAHRRIYDVVVRCVSDEDCVGVPGGSRCVPLGGSRSICTSP